VLVEVDRTRLPCEHENANEGRATGTESAEHDMSCAPLTCACGPVYERPAPLRSSPSVHSKQPERFIPHHPQRECQKVVGVTSSRRPCSNRRSAQDRRGLSSIMRDSRHNQRCAAIWIVGKWLHTHACHREVNATLSRCAGTTIGRVVTPETHYYTSYFAWCEY
jgi:hypothetical protein